MNATGKRLAIALAISVMLNLFLLGFMSARLLHGPFAHGELHGPFFGPRGLLSRGAPPGAAGERVRGMMERRREAMRSQRAALRDAQHAVRDALSKEPFDATALERALEQLKRATADSQSLMHSALLEIAPSLTAEQRQQLARDGRAWGGWGGMQRPR
jgi:Spy/CpxP family protein refolding chaperone